MNPASSQIAGTICLLVPPQDSATDWQLGPLQLEWADGVATDSTVRSTYLATRAGGVLYDASRRFHLSDLDEALPADPSHHVRVVALERLDHTVDTTPTASIGIVHLEATGPMPAAALNKLVRPPAGGDTLSPLGAIAVERGWFRRPLERGRRVGSALLLTPPRPLSSRQESGWSELDHALWSAAALTPEREVPPDEDDPSLLAGTIHLSATWRGLSLRDGVGFVVFNDVDGHFASAVAPKLVRTVYTDCVVLAALQRVELSALADQLAGTTDRRSDGGELERIERRATVMRSRLWWDDVTSHGPGNQILRACQVQQRTQELLDRVMDDLGVYRAVVDSAALKEAGEIQQQAEKREAAFEKLAKRAGVVFAAVSFSLTALAVSITGWTDSGVTMASAISFVVGAVALAVGIYELTSWVMRRR